MKFSLNKGKFLPVVFIIGMYLLAQIFLPYLTIRIFPESNSTLLRVMTLVYQFLAICLILMFIRKNETNSIDKSKNKFSLLKSIGVGIVFFLVMILLQLFLGIILQILGMLFGFDARSANTSEIAGIVKQQPLFILFVVIFAPILEELVFRKAIFGYLYDILSENGEKLRFLTASAFTGIIFAIPHDGFSPQLVVYIIMSMVFSYAYRLSSNIVVPIVAHMLMNALVMIIQYYLV